MRERDVSTSRGRWLWSLDGRVYHELSITDMFAGCLKSRVTVCNKVTFLFNWQLMKRRAHSQIYTLLVLTQLLYNRECKSEQTQWNKDRKKKERDGGNACYYTVLFGSIQGTKRKETSNVTVEQASPCAVSAFRPLGGNFWVAPSSVRRCIRRQQVKPTARAQRFQSRSFRGKLNKTVLWGQCSLMKYRFMFPPKSLQGL